MRELIWQANARRRIDWNHTASILAMLAEINRDHKKRSKPFSAEDFHPDIIAERERKAAEVKVNRGNFDALKGLASGKVHREWKEAGS